MASDLAVKRLTKELRSLQKDPIRDPNVAIMPLENNILEMHYVIEGSANTPYEGGIYHGKLVFPKEYPLKPPSVIMMTPSGRFQPGRRLCLSMSDFHPETWNPMWSVSTILTGLYSFMLETAPTLGSVESSIREKKQYAKKSLAHNVKDANFRRLFPQYVELYEASAAEESASGATSSSESGGALMRNHNERLEFHGIMATVAGLFAILSIVLAVRFF